MAGGGNARVLDICCGRGAPGRRRADVLGCSVVGVDSSEAALQQLQTSTDAHVRGVGGEAGKLPFRANRFDAALVLDSIASIPSVQQVFEEVARVLRPGGRLGCTAETGQPLTAAERARFTPSNPATVIQRCDLVNLLEDCGFQIVEVLDSTRRTARIASRSVDSLREHREVIGAELGDPPVDDLLATLGTLADMLGTGRLQESPVIAQRD